MEVEFDIQMKSGDLYDYMLKHTFSSPSGLIGAIVGALLVILGFSQNYILCMIAGIVVLCYLPITLFTKSKRQFLMNPAFKQPLHYKMTEEGVEVSQGESKQQQEWENMVKAVSTTKSIILYTSFVNASIFPRRELGDQAEAVVRMISTHMPAKKVKIRW